MPSFSAALLIFSAVPQPCQGEQAHSEPTAFADAPVPCRVT
jgi:hypothetical protein